MNNVPGSQTLNLFEARYPVRAHGNEIVAFGEYFADALLHTLGWTRLFERVKVKRGQGIVGEVG